MLCTTGGWHNTTHGRWYAYMHQWESMHIQAWGDYRTGGRDISMLYLPPATNGSPERPPVPLRHLKTSQTPSQVGSRRAKRQVDPPHCPFLATYIMWPTNSRAREGWNPPGPPEPGIQIHWHSGYRYLRAGISRDTLRMTYLAPSQECLNGSVYVAISSS